MADLTDQQMMGDSMTSSASEECGKVGADGLLVICASDDGTYPSDIWGLWVFVMIIVAFIVGSIIFIIFCMGATCAFDKRRQNKTTAVQKERIESLTSKLECKPWHGGSNWSTTQQTMSLRADEDCSSDDISSDSSLERRESPIDTDGAPRPFQQKGSSACAMCSEPFVQGEQLYQSNNPQCLHWQHKHCMDKWLQCQNTCPTCNQSFVVQSAV